MQLQLQLYKKRLSAIGINIGNGGIDNKNNNNSNNNSGGTSIKRRSKHPIRESPARAILNAKCSTPATILNANQPHASSSSNSIASSSSIKQQNARIVSPFNSSSNT